MSTDILTRIERIEVDKWLTRLRDRGYAAVEQSGQLHVGGRVRHRGHQWPEALTDGTGVILALTERPDSPWTASWGMADVELVIQWDDPSGNCFSRLSQLSGHHVVAVGAGAEIARGSRKLDPGKAYRGEPLVVRRDRVVVWGGTEIGRVAPDPHDHRVNHGWVYHHGSNVTLRQLHPDWHWSRVQQDASTKRAAARDLVDLHLEIKEASR